MRKWAKFLIFGLAICLSYAFSSKSEAENAARSEYVELRLKAHIWANVFHDFDAKGKKLRLTRAQLEDIRKRFPLCEEWEIKKLKAELEKGARFFLINSKFRLNLAIETVVHNELVFRSEITKGDFPWFTVKDELYGKERRLGQEGSYDGIIHIERLFALGESGELVRVRGGGGFTWGVDDEMKTAGISAWAMTPPGHPSNNFWLFTHEFHHQLDRMFELSGHPEYWFNHFAKPEGTAGPFGEHFDGNAWILRTWPGELYFALTERKGELSGKPAFGSIKYFTDIDGDGFPDEDNGLSFDEKRFGSLPTRKDTDEDGLTDLEEALLWQWAEPGLGEELSKAFRLPNPLKPDTDGDGLKDGEDILPLFPVSPLVPKTASPIKWSLKAMDESGISATLKLSWDENELSLQVSATKPVEVKVLLDGLGDGWWKEADNIYFETSADGTIRRKHVVNGTAEDKWCFDDTSLLGEDSIVVEKQETNEGVLYKISVKANEKYSFLPKERQVIGLNVGFRKPAAELPTDAQNYYTTFFEPNVLKWLIFAGEDELSAEECLRRHLEEVLKFRKPEKPMAKENEN